MFAARLDEYLPRLEAHVAAASARPVDEPLDACVREAGFRSSELDAIVGSLFEGTDPGTWTDVEARALAGPSMDAAELVRKCLACGPRHGCGDAARALVRVENALRIYQIHRSGT
jgi:hypothetical protein